MLLKFLCTLVLHYWIAECVLWGFTPGIRRSLSEEMWLGNGGKLWIIPHTAACNLETLLIPHPFTTAWAPAFTYPRNAYLSFWFFFSLGHADFQGLGWNCVRNAAREPQVPEEKRIFPSLDEFLRGDKLNLAQKVSKIHLVQQVNKSAPTQGKQKIRWNYRKKPSPELISQYAKLIPCWTDDLWS